MRIFQGDWFLNPWAEVRRLKAQLRRSHYAEEQAWIAAGCCSDAEDKLFAENADLRRRIAEMEKWVPRDPRIADPVTIKMQREAQGVKFS